jgi:hypothetical protein
VGPRETKSIAYRRGRQGAIITPDQEPPKDVLFPGLVDDPNGYPQRLALRTKRICALAP